MTAATNSAVESSSTLVINHAAGTIVRYGRIAKPTTSQATTHTANRAPGYWLPVNSPSPVVASPRPISPPSAAPRMRM